MPATGFMQLALGNTTKQQVWFDDLQAHIGGSPAPQVATDSVAPATPLTLPTELARPDSASSTLAVTTLAPGAAQLDTSAPDSAHVAPTPVASATPTEVLLPAPSQENTAASVQGDPPAPDAPTHTIFNFGIPTPAPKVEPLPLPALILYRQQEMDLMEEPDEEDPEENNPDDGGSTKLDPTEGGGDGGDGGDGDDGGGGEGGDDGGSDGGDGGDGGEDGGDSDGGDAALEEEEEEAQEEGEEEAEEKEEEESKDMVVVKNADGTAHVAYTDEEGNVVFEADLNPGESATLPDGRVVTYNTDGSISETAVIPLGDVTVIGTVNPSNGELLVTSFDLAGDTQAATFNTVNLLAEGNVILKRFGKAFGVIGILAGGGLALYHMYMNYKNNTPVSYLDIMSFLLAVLAVAFIGLGIEGLLELALQLGTLVWDIYVANH